MTTFATTFAERLREKIDTESAPNRWICPLEQRHGLGDELEVANDNIPSNDNLVTTRISEDAELDALLKEYHQAVEKWITRIREESALAPQELSVKAVDVWEAAGFHQEEARKKVKTTKTTYAAALRRALFKC